MSGAVGHKWPHRQLLRSIASGLSTGEGAEDCGRPSEVEEVADEEEEEEEEEEAAWVVAGTMVHPLREIATPSASTSPPSPPPAATPATATAAALAVAAEASGSCCQVCLEISSIG